VLLWSSLLVTFGVLLFRICLLYSSVGGKKWLGQVLLGDGAHWQGLIDGLVGWSFLIQAASVIVITFLGVRSYEPSGAIIRAAGAKLTVLAFLCGIVKSVLAEPLVSAYRGLEGDSFSLQWSAAPWIAFGGWLDVLIAAAFVGQGISVWKVCSRD